MGGRALLSVGAKRKAKRGLEPKKVWPGLSADFKTVEATGENVITGSWAGMNGENVTRRD